MSGIDSEIRYLAVRATDCFEYKEEFWKQPEFWESLRALERRIDEADERDL